MDTASKIAEQLLHEAISSNASDVHFFPFADHATIHFRVLGGRIHHKTIPISQYDVLLTYYKFTSGMDIGEVRKPQDGTIIHELEGNRCALRLSTLPLNRTESLAIRILPQDQHHSLEKLFLFQFQLKKLKSWIKNRNGIILFTGPTGSGKTTTLYTLLQTILAEKSYQTITLEDPVEKDIHDILQVQVNEKAGITYQTGLKAALRHDPDIIMIGEIRDRFTAQFAFDASLTGHLVLSTLHAGSAEGTIQRLWEMGIGTIDMQQSLIAVAALELLPIKLKDHTERAAIMEMLDGQTLEHTLNNDSLQATDHFDTFHHLRKKAFAYGFITEDTLSSSGH
ncbi:competence protein ComGA [Lentibacillus halophilus]|uniref:Competence protein ComGA n=1 Tax=Lentibacillus halophilus TaxID=295065 RepID=A0ABN0ZD42_9BACI